MSIFQKTIQNTVSITGAGLHTGQEVTLSFKPAKVDHGIKFQRIDIEGKPVIAADVDLVVDTSRGTTLEKGGHGVMTVEHVLAAVAGLNIDNLLIETNGLEMPIMDGSSKYFIETLENAGTVEQEKERFYYEINTNLAYTDPENKVEMLLIPSDEFRLSVMIDFETDVLSTQHAVLDKMADFKDEISTCRTFVFLHELQYLINNNLIKGGDFNNAIVFVDKIISQEELDKLATFFNKPKVEVLNEGILNNLELAFPNEPARHKLLDVVGDLSLVGTHFKGHVIAKRPGHLANVEFAKVIKKHIKEQTAKNKAPILDPNATPLYDVNDIMEILPHRSPFLLVDKVMEMTSTMVVAMKNVTMNEAFFVGHFPDEPVMPGVLQVEAMGQAGGILVLSGVPNPKDYIAYFLKFENVKFRHKVVPGDTLLFKLELVSPIRRGICHMKGYAFVGDRVVTEGEMMAQIIKKEK